MLNAWQNCSRHASFCTSDCRTSRYWKYSKEAFALPSGESFEYVFSSRDNRKSLSNIALSTSFVKIAGPRFTIISAGSLPPDKRITFTVTFWRRHMRIARTVAFCPGASLSNERRIESTKGFTRWICSSVSAVPSGATAYCMPH